jgi:hypothetical protein
VQEIFFQALQALTEGSVPSDVPVSSDTQIPSASGASVNDQQTPESSPTPVGSGAPSPISEGSNQQSPETRRWFRGEFRNVLREEGLSIPPSLASTPSSSLEATPVQAMAESTAGPSTPGPQTPELLERAVKRVKRLFDDTKDDTKK